MSLLKARIHRRTESPSVSRQIRLMWPLIVGAVGLILFSVGVFWAASSTGNTALGAEVKPGQIPAGVPVRISASQLRSGKLVVLQVAGIQQVPFVVMHPAGGVVRAALASCRVCYARHQHNEFHELGVVCARCRKRMRLPGPQDPEKKLACDLVKLPYREENGDVLISHDDLSRANRILSETKSSQ